MAPTLVTAEPSSRSVLIARTMAALGVIVVGLAVVYGAVNGAFDLLPSDQTSDLGAATGDTDTPSTATPSTATIGSEPLAAMTQETQVVPELGVPPLATRYIDLPTTRVLDTRGNEGPPLQPGATTTAEISQLVPTSAITVVMSVNVAMAQGPGLISVDAGGASIKAFEVSKAGQMTTNLVVVPYLSGEPLTVATVGGGHLVVDVVGYFEESDAAAAGRFVPVATQRIARLVTEIDGRETTVSPLDNPALPASGVSAVLVRISADVGAEGGMVRVGASHDGLPNTMMWAATSGDDRTRQGLAIVTLSELDELAFSYNGGSVLDLDVLGYFTDETALVAESGLFEPRPDGPPITVEVAAGESTIVDVAGLLDVPAADVGAILANVFTSAATPGALFVHAPGQAQPGSATVELGSGGSRFGFTATEIGDDGSIVLTSDVDVTATLVVPGYFRS